MNTPDDNHDAVDSLKAKMNVAERLPLIIALILSAVIIPRVSSAQEQLFINDISIINTQTLTVAEKDIVINAGRIQRIESNLDPEDYQYAHKIKGKGKYLIPGLTDSHVHLTMIPGLGLPNKAKARKHPDLVQAYQAQLPKSYLYFGVTQVLDLSATGKALADFNRHPIGPKAFGCAAMPLLNGYPLVYQQAFHAQDFPYYLIEPKNNDDQLEENQQHTVATVIKRIKNDGFHCIKIFIENGFGNTDNWPMPAEKTLRRIIQEAKAHQLMVFAHANAIDMQQIAIDINADVLSHGLWNWNQYQQQSGIPEPIKHVIDEMIEKDIAYQPTLRVMGGLIDLFNPHFLSEPNLQKAVPEALLEWYKSNEAKAFTEKVRRQGLQGLTDERVRSILYRKKIEPHHRIIRALSEKKHALYLASDTPANQGYTNQPGHNTWQELNALHHSGLPLGEILQAATLNNAKLLNNTEDYGNVEINKKANLLILTSNPLENIEAYNQIEKVILNGLVIERESLAAKNID